VTPPELTLAVRNLGAAEPVAASSSAQLATPNIFLGRVDLADLSSITEFAAQRSGQNHVPVNNAGIESSLEHPNA
jgi:hypothetical protein